MKFRQTLFWDTNAKKVNLKKNAKYVIERVLDFGNDTEVKQLWGLYDKKLIKKIVINSRSLRPETKKLWTLLLKSK